MTHQSAYGLPLQGTDTEFYRFLRLRENAEHMTGVALRLRRMRERFRRVTRVEERVG